MEHVDFAERREGLLQSIERDQEEVRGAVQELVDAAQVRFDVRERVKESPLAWVIGACLVGLWLGSRGAPAAAAGQRRS